MPRPVINHGKDFNYTFFECSIVIQSNISSETFTGVVKQENNIIFPPAAEKTDPDSTISQLSLSEFGLVFYRCETKDDEVLRIEMLRFDDSVFIITGFFDVSQLSLKKDGKLLNDCFWMNEINENMLIIHDLCTQKMCEMELLYDDYVGVLLQNNFLYLYRKSYEIGPILSFSSQKEPILIEQHPLFKKKYNGIDITPGDCHFLHRNNEEYFNYSIVDGYSVLVPINYELPNVIKNFMRIIWPHLNAFIRYEGLVIRDPAVGDVLHADRVCCALWDFVTLGDTVYSTVYNPHECTTQFNPIIKCETLGDSQFTAAAAR
ncbi:hypothetical protein PCE1_003288 [Barthelona sp. PCE]